MKNTQNDCLNCTKQDCSSCKAIADAMDWQEDQEMQRRRDKIHSKQKRYALAD
jgi:hypothetical protein